MCPGFIVLTALTQGPQKQQSIQRAKVLLGMMIKDLGHGFVSMGRSYS